MNNKRSTEIKVGMVSLAALIILIVGLIYGKGLALSPTVPIKIRFPNSGGIQLTSPVLINGVKRGSVTSVINDKGNVLITADMDNINDLYSDATARITILEITGGKKIEITPGISKSKLNPSSEITGETPADIADLVAIAGGMINDLGGLVKRIDTVAYSVNTMLADGKMNTQIRSILTNADNLSGNLNSLLNNNMSDINESIKSIKSITTDLKASIGKNEPKVSKLVDELDGSIKQLNNLLGKTHNTIGNADALLADFKNISEQVKSGKGLAGKLIYDQKFANQLDSTFNSLTEFINLLKQYGVNVNVRLGTRP